MIEEIIIKKEKTVLQRVPTGEFEEVIKYKTTDGTEFDSVYDAKKHDRIFVLNRAEKVEIDLDMYDFDIGGPWFKAKNQTELQDLRDALSSGASRIYNVMETKIGEWFTTHYEYDPDGPDTVKFITLSRLQNNIHLLMEQLT